MSNAKCLDDTIAMQTAVVLNTFCEFLLATMPLLAVIRLGIEREKWWIIIGLLSFGYIVGIVGCFRIFFVWRAIQTFDFTWWANPQWLCSEVENNLAIICACAVPLQPVAIRTYSYLRGSDKSSRNLQSSPSQVTQETRSQQTQPENEEVVNQIHREANAEDVTEWSDIVRQVDLEGLTPDALGYTVTVTGPKRQSAILRGWHKTASFNLYRLRSPARKPSECRSHWEIPIQTKIVVGESCARPVRTGNEEDRIASSPTDIGTVDDIDNVFAPLEYLGDSSILAPALDGKDEKKDIG